MNPDEMNQPETNPDRDKEGLPVIHTYASDIASAVKQKEGTVVSIAMAEEKRRSTVEGELKSGTNKNKFFIIAGAVLLVLTIGIVYIAFVGKKTPINITPSTELPVPPGLATSDVNVAVDLTNAKTKEVVEKTIEDGLNSLEVGSSKIGRIYFFETLPAGKSYVAPLKLFEKMKWRVPGRLARAVLPIYTVGVVNTAGEETPFMLVEADSFDTAFSGMLEWEKYLFDDFENIFSLTRPSADRARVVEFQDKVIQNQNARVVISDTGGIVFYYALIGNKVLIARDSQALAGVLAHTSL